MIIIRDHFDNCESASLRAAYKHYFKELMPTIKEPKGRKAGALGVLSIIDKERAKILCDRAEKTLREKPYCITPQGIKMYRRLRELISE